MSVAIKPARVRILAASALAFALSACSPEATQEPPRSDDRTGTSGELTAEESTAAGAANDFAFALLSRAAADNGGEANLVLSPLSASFALGMLLNGATGETRAGMEQALRLAGVDAGAANQGYAGLMSMLTELDEDVTVDIANAIFARDGVVFEQAFLDTAAHYFDASVRVLDFADPASPGVINAWVRAQTNDRIDEMVGEIDPRAIMYLLNAIYFKGDWTRSFDPARTQPMPFTRADGSTVEVPMMDMDEARHLFLQREDGVVAIDLAYGRGAWSMTLVPPPQDTDAYAYAASLDRAAWDSLVAEMDTVERVMVRMPRFTLEHERILNDDLRALGMQRAFTDEAQFDRLTAEAAYIHEVKQKSFLAVDEHGTEAAAVTSVEVRVVSMPPHIFLDRPFVFAIRERSSGVILFVGVIGDPS